MRKNPYSISSYIDEKGNSLSEFDLYEKSASTPEEKQEFKDVRLNNLKDQQIVWDNDRFVSGNRDRQVDSNFVDMERHNKKLRQEINKVTGNGIETNKLMKAKTFDHYKKFRKKNNPAPFETVLDNIKKPKTVMTPSTSSSSFVNSGSSQEVISEPKKEKEFNVEEYVKRKAKERMKAEDDYYKKTWGLKGIAGILYTGD